MQPKPTIKKSRGFLPSSASFKRNVGLFLFILLVFTVFFGVYWYKFVPGNRDEFNERGFRTLRQLSTNIATKYDGLQKDLLNIYSNTGTCYQMDRQFHESFLNYVVDKIGYDTGKCKFSWFARDTIAQHDSSQVKECNDDFHFSFTVPGRGDISLSMPKYLKNILSTRNDVFESYLLLLRPQKTEQGFRSEFKMSDSAATRSNYDILYENTTLSGTDRLNIDSALKLEKNGDLTSIIKATIAGKSYKLFVQPFRMHDEEMALVGLVSEDGYTKEIKSVPVGFASALIVIMIVLLSVLPLIKIFFVGAKERISAKDVLTMNLAIYIGTSFLVLILLYFCIAFVATRTFNTRLQEVSGQISSEFNGDLQRAGSQLDKYEAAFQPAGRFDSAFYTALQNKSIDRRLLDDADRLFLPDIYRNFSRVYWMDEKGGTLIKWNPYNIHIPLSDLKKDPYYDSLLKITPPPDGAPSRDLILYAGKSNITGEFQVLISRLSQDSFADPCHVHPLVKAHSVTMAAFPNCSNYPILPPGFSFSIIDDANFDVLINSDPRRNLAENMMDETMENEKLRYAVRYKVSGPIDPVDIYGSDHVFLITPLEGTRLSLLVYYDKAVIFHNIFRLIHFAAESLLYLFCALALCVIATTGFSNRPGKLRFNLKQVGWVRPSIRNLQSYRFTGAYGALLFLFTVLFSFLLAAFPKSLMMIFYISLLLPLYTLWGFVSSRKKESVVRRPDAPRYRYFLIQVIGSGNAIFFFVLVFNYVFWNLIQKEMGEHRLLHHVLLLLYQAGALFLFYYFYRDNFFMDREKGRINAIFRRLRIIPQHSGEDFSRMYLVSLCWSVWLISIVPVIGILGYGYQSESIQFLKSKQLSLASAYESRVSNVANAITDDYKPAVRNDPGFSRFIDSLKYQYSQYLFYQDTIYPADSGARLDAVSDIPDVAYSYLLDSLFLITPDEYATFSIKDRSADSSWRFCQKGQHLYLDYKRGAEGQASHHLVVSTAGNPFTLFARGDWFRIALMTAFCFFMLFLGSRLLDAVVHRIFLLKYYEHPPDGSNLLVEKYLSPAVRKWTGIADMTTEEVLDFFLRERAMRDQTVKYREEYILSMTVWLTPYFEKLWKALDSEEQFFLYDFALDGYANYKDAEMLTRLTEMKLLLYEYSHFRLFSLSFRNFLLAKKATAQVIKLKAKYAAPGIWETMRIPALVLIAVAGIFIFTTQDDLAHKISAILTSIGAMIPLLLKLTGRNASEG
ncbi:MAG TPA: hypothetical protein VNW04_17620 [Puia sp.]|nr:hypothetical protein [Puia sp.]